MLKALLIGICVGVGAGLGVTTYQLSQELDDQTRQIQQLHRELNDLRDREIEVAASTLNTDMEFSGLNDFAPTSESATLDNEELRSLVGQLIEDQALLGSLAQQVGTRLDPSNTLYTSPHFKDSVRNTMEEVREEQREEQRARREEEMLARTENRAKEIAEQLNLPPGTANELTQIMLDGAQARTDMFTLMRSGEFGRGDVRGMMREQRDDVNQQVQSILTESEYEQYQQLQQEDRGRSWFGGGRGGGGRNFGGGSSSKQGTSQGEGRSGGSNSGGNSGGGGRGGGF